MSNPPPRLPDTVVRLSVFCASCSLVPTLLGWAHWAVEVTKVLVPQAAVLAAACAVLAAVLRKWRQGAVLAAIALVHAATLWAAAPRASASPGQGAVTLLVANVHTANREHGKLRTLIARERPAVVGLIEVNATWLTALEPVLRDYPFRHALPREDNFGMALFSKLPVADLREETFGPAPTLAGTVSVAGRPVRLYLVHVWPPLSAEHTEDRDRQLARMAQAVKRDGGSALAAGDFNAVPLHAAHAAFVRGSGLQNVGGYAPTWPTMWPSFLRFPIDHVFASRDLVVERRVGPPIGSDHLPLVLRVGRR